MLNQKRKSVRALAWLWGTEAIDWQVEAFPVTERCQTVRRKSLYMIGSSETRVARPFHSATTAKEGT